MRVSCPILTDATVLFHSITDKLHLLNTQVSSYVPMEETVFHVNVVIERWSMIQAEILYTLYRKVRRSVMYSRVQEATFFGI